MTNNDPLQRPSGGPHSPFSGGEYRILQINAALDGELDAMSALEFERAMRDDPALQAEYRRLAALREAVQRHAPREKAPQALA
ncbi:MAG: hypothetical protein JO223_07290, partial [Hyphomicrobiales bacterium]|nr:hypothetical protein [Hyphomicrobiales bacterium]